MPGKPNPEKDERVKLPPDPETVLRAMLKVNPEDESAEDQEKPGGENRAEH